ncbi:hypothetical protein [Algoriphagus sp. CAU 1675]|uniref:hypothetical protein n=1 Tax=Algoriphagus sp. CAU 1675 TaxID=3032597 RepID=UPI0023DBDD34|nr:hypothetical protein [Algoriphagus sp. CAU 1675]MDF2159283.1 hypothetical protein [Algoriphagus sp. CAU 1675]
MRVKSIFSLVLVVASLAGMFSCLDEKEKPEDGIFSGPADCALFSYSDTIFYINPNQNQFIVPDNPFQGTYTASPEGLVIDPLSGIIDINSSETGLKYKVTFTASNLAGSCETYLTIGGVNYEDKIYVLDQNQILAAPIYNAVPGLPLPCPDDDGVDDGSIDDDSCDFDVENPTGELLEDLGFEISSKGEFDLLTTVENGTFGEVPVNGAFLDVELYYQLPDLSANTLNSIPLRFFYFETMDDIPQELLDDLNEKSGLINENKTGNSNNLRLSNYTRPAGKPRPPFIVIVASLQ